MRIFPKGLRDDLKSLENSLSLLVTITNPTVKWSGIPKSEIKILKERMVLIDHALDEIYSRLNNYEVG
jgi:hypothetical protein